MKNLKHLMTFAVIAALAIFVGCKDDTPEQDPKVEIAQVAVDETSITVRVTPSHAAECAVTYITKGEDAPNASKILAEGTKLSASEDSEYKIEELAAGTTYVIYAAVSADNKSAVSHIEVTTQGGDLPSADAQFAVSFEVLAENVNITVKPQDETTPYFYYIMEKTVFDETYQGDAALAAQSDINKIINEYYEFMGGTAEEALSQMLLVGESTSSFPVNGNRQYVCYVCYTDAKVGTVIGNVEIYEFAGPEVAPSSNTFTIEVLNTTSRSIEYSITPSNEDTYSYFFVTKEEFDQQPIDEYIASLIYMNGIFMPRTSGYYSDSRDYLSADTEYVVLAFGYQAGICTTEPTTMVVKTQPQGDPSKCTFEVNARPLNRYQIGYTITPSDESIAYYYDLCLANQTAEEIEATLIAAIEEEVAMGWWTNVGEYFAVWATYGAVEDKTLVNPIPEGFKVYAAAVDTKTGEFAGEFFFSDVCTMPEFTASDITIDCTIDKYYDGAELAELLPYIYGGWGEENVYFTPKFTFENGTPVEYYYQVYQYDPAYEDHSTYDEDWAIPALIQMGYPYPDAEMYMPWGFDGYLMCVAVDSEGNFSSLYRQKISFDREGAAPAEEHPYNNMEFQNAPNRKAEKQRTKVSLIK